MATCAEEAGAHDYNDEAEEEDGLGPRQSSGISHLPDFGGDDAEGNRSRKRRPNTKGGSARAAAKGNRRRRLDEEDEQAEQLRVNRKRKRGDLTAPISICPVSDRCAAG